MEIDSGICHQKYDLDQSRYNPMMRKIWPWPSVLLENVATWSLALPGRLWLDAACGEGQLGDLLAKRKRLLGLDIDYQRLLRARQRGYWGLLEASVTALPLPDGLLSGIISVETLEHIHDLDAALCEFARCLRTNGYVLVTVPSVTLRSLWQMHRKGQPVYSDSKEHDREFSAIHIRGFPHMFETWKSLETRFHHHGFKVLRSGGVGFLLPMWHGRLALIEHVMNCLYRETINRWLGRLPGLRNFPYYRMYLLQNEGKR